MPLSPQAPPLLWRCAGALTGTTRGEPTAFRADPGGTSFWQVGVGALSARAPAGVAFSNAVATAVRAIEPSERPIVALDHAGPAAFAFSTARARGATDAVDASSGRRPEPLSSTEWDALGAAMQSAANALHDASIAVGLVLDDDGLLHHALNPRSGFDPARASALVVDLLRAVRPTWVALPADDLTPGGLDATACLALAEVAVAHGAKRLLASAGTAALLPLQRRQKGSLPVDARLFLVPAVSLAKRLQRAADVWAVVPAHLRDRAASLVAPAQDRGLAGVAVQAGEPS